MSREFGDSGYCFFHEHIRLAAQDASSGEGQVTKLLAPLLDVLYPVAYAVSSEEACDAGSEAPIIALWRALPELEKNLRALKAFIEPYDRLAQAAVRDAAAVA